MLSYVTINNQPSIKFKYEGLDLDQDGCHCIHNPPSHAACFQILSRGKNHVYRKNRRLLILKI